MIGKILNNFFGKGTDTEFADELKNYKDDERVSSSGTDIYSGWLDEEENPLLNEPRLRAEFYDKMHREDGTIGMCLRAAESPILASKWTLQIKEKFIDDPNAQMQLDVTKKLLKEADLKEIVRLLLKEIKYGYTLMERFYRPCGVDGAMYLKPRVVFMHPKSIRQWITDEYSDLVSVRQESYGDDRKDIFIPADRLVLSSNDAEGLNYEGISYLRQCFAPNRRKQTIFKKMAIGVDKLAIPFLKIYRDTTASKLTEKDREFFKQALDRRRKGELNSLLFPAGYTADEESTSFDPVPLFGAIKGENEIIVKNFLANFLLLGESGGSFAMSKDLSDFYLACLENKAAKFEDIITDKIIRPTIKLNFADNDCMIKCSHSEVGGRAGETLAKTLGEVINSGAVKPDKPLEEHIRKKLNLPEIDEETTYQSAVPAEPPTTPIEPFSKKKAAATYTNKQAMNQAARSQKRIEKLREQVKEVYIELIDDYSKRKIKKMMTKVSGKTAPEIAKIDTKDFKISGIKSSEVKAIVRNAFEEEYDDYIKIFGKYNNTYDKTTVLALIGHVVASDIEDLEQKIDRGLALILFGEASRGNDPLNNKIAITAVLADEAEAFATEGAAKASVVSSKAINQARRSVEQRAGDTIESYTFYNPSPVAPICRYLRGKTISPQDVGSYQPPLHYNCSTVLIPNLREFKNNPNTQVLTPNKEQLKSISNV